MKNVLLALFIAALLVVHALIGGTRLIFSLPTYSLLGLAALLACFHRPAEAFRVKPTALLATALLVAYAIGRAVLSPVAYLAWPDFAMLLGCGLTYLLVGWHFGEVRDRQLIVAALLLLAAVEVLLALHQFTTGDNYMFFGFHRPNYGRRGSGLLISPNHLAGLLEMTGLLALASACWSEGKLAWRILAGYLAVSCFVGVAVTGSRGGYLSLGVGLAFFLIVSVAIVWRADRNRGVLFGVLGAGVLAVAVWGGWEVMQDSSVLHERVERLGAQFTGSDRDVRVYNWRATLDQAQVSPVFGTGSGTHLYYGRYFRSPELQSDPIHAHSDYLELLAEYGIVGAVLMAIFLGVHLTVGSRRAIFLVRHEMLSRGHLRNSELALLLGALSALVALLVHSAIDFNLHVPGNALVVAFLLAVLGSDREKRMTRPAAAPAWRWALPVLGLVTLLWSLSKVTGEFWGELARQAYGVRDFPLAIERAKKGLSSEQDNPYLFFYLGEAKRAYGSVMPLRSQKKIWFEESTVAFRKSLALLPQDGNTWTRLGQAYDGLKYFSAAEEAHRTAIDLDPNLSVAYAYYAAHLQLCGRMEDAAAVLRKGALISGRNLDAVLRRALDSAK